ncbi:MAG: Flp family type IVb pilin [Bradyrhizobiaceae bacterium]|nr:Flp family type IVb pilin [Bradyrhizobiaceae bacterium]
MRIFARFVRDEAGASSVKYGLIAACISMAIVTVLHSVGPKLVDTLAAAE